MPILKQLVSGANAKRRSRMDLTREMISAPLGDFRHTMHVGRSGDAFGDTSFLATRSGEPPESASYPSSPRPGLLSRTFRSSKRSQSVTRVDQQAAAPPPGRGPYVKNAMSLPFLADGERADGGAPLTSSLTCSPCKVLDGGPGGATSHFLEIEERSFGEPTELPESSKQQLLGGGGMKHAESVLSFHLDLGPSMLGDILGVMEKEDDDLGYEEGKSSEGHGEEGEGGEKEEEEQEEEVAEKTAKLHLGSSPAHPGPGGDGAPYAPLQLPEDDGCSASSSGSAPPLLQDGKLVAGQAHSADTDSATFSAPPPEEEEEEREGEGGEEEEEREGVEGEEEEEEESRFSSFLEDEDDEIRV